MSVEMHIIYQVYASNSIWFKSTNNLILPREVFVVLKFEIIVRLKENFRLYNGLKYLKKIVILL